MVLKDSLLLRSTRNLVIVAWKLIVIIDCFRFRILNQYLTFWVLTLLLVRPQNGFDPINRNLVHLSLQEPPQSKLETLSCFFPLVRTLLWSESILAIIIITKNFLDQSRFFIVLLLTVLYPKPFQIHRLKSVESFIHCNGLWTQSIQRFTDILCGIPFCTSTKVHPQIQRSYLQINIKPSTFSTRNFSKTLSPTFSIR